MKMKGKIILGLATVAMVPAILTGCGHDHSSKEEWKSDETHHWHECTGEDCKENLEKEEHEATGTWLSTDTHHYKDCECGYDMNMEEHNFGEFETSSTHHWKSCAECGYQSTKVEHTLEHGLCSCGHYAGEVLTVDKAKTNINLAQGEKAYFRFVAELGKHYALTMETQSNFSSSEIKYYGIYKGNFKEIEDFEYIDNATTDGYVYIEITASTAKENAQFCVYRTGNGASLEVEGTDTEKQLSLGTYDGGESICAKISLKKGYKYAFYIESNDMICAEITNICNGDEVAETTIVDGKLIVDLTHATEDFDGNVHIFINSNEPSQILKVSRYCLLESHTVDTYGHCTSCKAFTGKTESVNGYITVDFDSNETIVYRFEMKSDNYNIKFATSGANAGKTFNYVAYTAQKDSTSGDVKNFNEFEEFGETPSDDYVQGDYIYLLITPNGTDTSVTFQVEETI